MNSKMLNQSWLSKPGVGVVAFVIAAFALLEGVSFAQSPDAVEKSDAPKSQLGAKLDGANLLVGADPFIAVFSGDIKHFETFMKEIDRTWSPVYVPMLLESARFFPQNPRTQVIRLLEEKTGNKFGDDFDRWWQWHWKANDKEHPEYTEFKSRFYSKLDPRFAEYFELTENATIRLDEIRWGGVKRDGIPPLKDPEMLEASDADYLADSDIVFGIQLNEDARAYPKRILAWHEMFKDTIGGESVCGVY